VSLLLAKVELVDVSVSKDTHDVTVLLDALEFRVRAIATLFLVVRKTLGVFCESLLFRVVPVLVESSLHLVVQVLSPDSGKSAETARSLDVTNQTNNAHRGSFDHGDGFNNLLVVNLGSWLVGSTKDVSHTGFVAHEGGKVAWLGSIILGKLANFAAVVGAPFAGKKTEGPVTGGFELTM
jgi:hypothetical protein